MQSTHAGRYIVPFLPVGLLVLLIGVIAHLTALRADAAPAAQSDASTRYIIGLPYISYDDPLLNPVPPGEPITTPTPPPGATAVPTATPPVTSPTATPPVTSPTATPPATTPTPTTPVPNPVQVNAWQRWEHRFTSSVENPLETTLQVTYRGPGGMTFSSYGFWDGGQSFAIRAMFPAAGTWTWETSGTSVAELNSTGSVVVGPAVGSNPLYQHGRLVVSANKRYLAHADGTPFLWLGDTAWDAPMQATAAEWNRYIDTRAAQGFSVVQIAPAASWFTSTDRNGQAPFDGAITRPNPAYWQEFERKVQYANEHGLVVAVIGVQDPIDDSWPSTSDAQQFAQMLVARLHGNHVVFAPSFDKQVSSLSDEVGQAIREATSIHLITQHPGTPSGSSTNTIAEHYYDRDYLDFAGNQTGHNNGDRVLTMGQAIDWNLSLYRRTPTKPVINLEAFYDANGTMPGEGGKYSGTAYDARALGYLSWLSGSLGYTYGARGLMIWEQPSNGAANWENALSYPSAGQMTMMRNILRGIAWWELQPAHERVTNQAGDRTKCMVLAISSAGDLGVAYLPDNSTIQIDMSGFAQTMIATWINPTTGERQSAGSAPNHGTATFTRPGSGDWLLLLQGQ